MTNHFALLLLCAVVLSFQACRNRKPSGGESAVQSDESLNQEPVTLRQNAVRQRLMASLGEIRSIEIFNKEVRDPASKSQEDLSTLRHLETCFAISQITDKPEIALSGLSKQDREFYLEGITTSLVKRSVALNCSTTEFIKSAVSLAASELYLDEKHMAFLDYIELSLELAFSSKVSADKKFIESFVTRLILSVEITTEDLKKQKFTEDDFLPFLVSTPAEKTGIRNALPKVSKEVFVKGPRLYLGLALLRLVNVHSVVTSTPLWTDEPKFVKALLPQIMRDLPLARNQLVADILNLLPQYYYSVKSASYNPSTLEALIKSTDYLQTRGFSGEGEMSAWVNLLESVLLGVSSYGVYAKSQNDAFESIAHLGVLTLNRFYSHPSQVSQTRHIDLQEPRLFSAFLRVLIEHLTGIGSKKSKLSSKMEELKTAMQTYQGVVAKNENKTLVLEYQFAMKALWPEVKK